MTKPKSRTRAKARSTPAPIPCHTTYAQSKGKPPYDWNRALREVTPESRDRLNRMRELAAQWVTCACGSQCELIPRSHALTGGGVGMPEDTELRRLGGCFVADVGRLGSARWSHLFLFEAARRSAQVTLAAIEARSAVLIQQVLKELAKPSRPPL